MKVVVKSVLISRIKKFGYSEEKLYFCIRNEKIMRKTILFALLLYGFSSQAQKLSPWLAQHVQAGTATSRAVTNNKTINTIDVLVKFSDDVSDADAAATLSAYGAERLTTIGRIHIVRLPLSQAGPLSQDGRVVRVEAERAPHALLDRVPQQVGADKASTGTDEALPQAFTGKDVVVGIVDGGFDYLHPFFRDAKGTTRITWAADYLTDKKYTTAAAVTAAQHSSDAATILHGTHVAGIAAGSRVNDINDVFYRGIALEADIAEATVDIEIRTDGTGLSSASSLRAFADIFAYADEQQKPCVINYSMGDAMSFSNNRQLENEAISTLLQKPGRALVVAAGNAGGTKRLVHKTTDMTSCTDAVMFNDEEGFGTYLGVEFKLQPGQNVTLKQTDSSYKTTKAELIATVQELATASTLTLGTKQLTVVNRGETADGYVVIYITSGHSTYTTTDRVLITVEGAGDAWLYADPLCAQLEKEVSLETSDLLEGYTMTWPAELDDVVSVGNIAHRMKILTAADKYAHRDSTDLAPYENTKGPGYIARSSSEGPSFSGQIRPDVCAPGVNVISALNNFINENTEMEYAGWLISHMDTEWEDDYGYSMTLVQSGTSMAAPVVTGTIALWLQADPTLTTAQIKDIIAHSSRQPDSTLPYPNNTYGFGEIDAYRGLLYMLNLTAISDLSHEQPTAVRFSIAEKQLSMRFTAPVAEDSALSLRVYATDGKLVYAADGHQLRPTADGHVSISLGQLPSGVYAVQLNTGNRLTTGSTLIRL